MPIRRRLAPRKKIAYHQNFGALSNPPLRGEHWPCGAEYVRLLGRKQVLVGFLVRRADYQHNPKEYGISAASEAMLLQKALQGKSDPIVETALAHYRSPPCQYAVWVAVKEVERVHYKSGWGTSLAAYVPAKRVKGYPVRKWEDDFNVKGDIKYLGEFPSKVEAQEAADEYYGEKFDVLL